jgi:hypothetical protein
MIKALKGEKANMPLEYIFISLRMNHDLPRKSQIDQFSTKCPIGCLSE